MPVSQKPSDTPAVSEGIEKAEEGDPYNVRDPQGAPRPASKDIGPNPAKLDGSALRRPDPVEKAGNR